MKLAFASDHAGYALKEALIEHAHKLEHDVEDFGPGSFNPEDDYPDFVSEAARAVSENKSVRAVILGGSGQGEAIVANRFPEVRAVVFYGGLIAHGAVDAEGRESKDPFEVIRLARMHNDANVLSLGARFITEAEAKQALEIWLATEFSNAPRHVRRVEKIDSVTKNVMV